ncbi:hypothetical protein NDI85_21080 [Halomicroarcula sp. S1AR25-4]|uniref:hypothetical protein n=1 Tax=Haloarcula sp. S1AR25-4 TaxID=2950538 RepID=UPI0028765707|nr:hypothetical protein [Halomicroarcula sp. S1AR25-4]MDS0280281.1 hypothetical protein [Halomicroarcula sp. S1AR25-4]
MSDLPDTDEAPRLREFLELLPTSTPDAASSMGVQPTTVEGYRNRLEKHHGIVLEYDQDENVWTRAGADVVDEAADDDEREELSEREAYIYRSLPSSIAALAEDLGVDERVVRAHLDVIAEKGWSLDGDDAGNYHGPDQDHLRSSEHKQTRTRKANKWWQKRHDELVHDFAQLEWPTSSLDAYAGNEDWVTHLTDLHAGDRIRRDDGEVVYETDMIPAVIDHITERSLSLADKHGSFYDAGHLLWGGDFITNEGIYEGQFEHLDAWLDEQHDILVAPLLRQIKAFAERFPTLQVVCQVGNHGQHRASGTSRQANADLILYKHIRNAVAAIREYSDDDTLENVQFLIGEAKAYRNFDMRGGEVLGHLRHGQDRRPQAETSARQNEWRGTLMDHDFDIAYMGHHHISGRIPWDGPPVFCTGSPKPAGEFVERLGGRPTRRYQDVATAHGVSDEGLTSAFPIDTRDFEP